MIAAVVVKYSIQYDAIQPTAPAQYATARHNQHPAPWKISDSQVETLTLVHHIVRENYAKRSSEEVLGILGRSTCEGDARGQRHVCPVSRLGCS